MAMSTYLLDGQPSELERLQLQSWVWEPAGRAVLSTLPSGAGKRALDIGCGVLGWLRVLSEWGAAVTGTDLDPKMLAFARSSVPSVERVQDDLFASKLPPQSFDLVHARFEIAPLGRAEEQLAAHRRLVKPGGWLVLEEPDSSSWRVNPDAPSMRALCDAIIESFKLAGGNFDAGRELPGLLRAAGLEPVITAHVVALDARHPYLRLPLQFATSLRSRLETLLGQQELDALLQRAESELSRPGTWGTTFTLVQTVAVVP
jgi:SAM-dependent methyltransferase